MALFEYFPNYVWNLSLAIAIENGGQIGEIIDMCAPLRDQAGRGEDVGTRDFMEQWVKKADTLVELAAEDEARSCAFSAAAKLQRAALYLFTAERMQGHGHPGREATYARAREYFDKADAPRPRDRATRGDSAAAGHDASAVYPGSRRWSAAGGRLLQWPRQLQGAALLVAPAAGAGAPRRSPPCASTSPGPVRRCACRVCPLRPTANAGPRRRSTGSNVNRRSTRDASA